MFVWRRWGGVGWGFWRASRKRRMQPQNSQTQDSREPSAPQSIWVSPDSEWPLDLLLLFSFTLGPSFLPLSAWLTEQKLPFCTHYGERDSWSRFSEFLITCLFALFASVTGLTGWMEFMCVHAAGVGVNTGPLSCGKIITDYHTFHVSVKLNSISHYITEPLLIKNTLPIQLLAVSPSLDWNQRLQIPPS